MRDPLSLECEVSWGSVQLFLKLQRSGFSPVTQVFFAQVSTLPKPVMRPGKASPPSEPCFFICKGIVVICDNCKDRLDVSRQKGCGISKVTFYRRGGDVLLVSCFGRELLGQRGGSHNHVQLGAMFRNLGVHSGDKRSGETWWLSFLGPCETGTFEAARGQKKPHRPPTPKTSLLLCSASVHKQR